QLGSELRHPAGHQRQRDGWFGRPVPLSAADAARDRDAGERPRRLHVRRALLPVQRELRRLLGARHARQPGAVLHARRLAGGGRGGGGRWSGPAAGVAWGAPGAAQAGVDRGATPAAMIAHRKDSSETITISGPSLADAMNWTRSGELAVQLVASNGAAFIVAT